MAYDRNTETALGLSRRALNATLLSVVVIGTYTLSTLPAATSDLVGKYARVTDLFGEKTDLLLCSQSGGQTYWQPVRPTYAKAMSGDADMTLRPLFNPSVIFLTGALTANRTLTLSTQGAFPGASFDIAMDGTLGIYSITIAGLSLGATLSLLTAGRRRVFYTAAGDWRSF